MRLLVLGSLDHPTLAGLNGDHELISFTGLRLSSAVNATTSYHGGAPQRPDSDLLHEVSQAYAVLADFDPTDPETRARALAIQRMKPATLIIRLHSPGRPAPKSARIGARERINLKMHKVIRSPLELSDFLAQRAEIFPPPAAPVGALV